MIKTIVTTSWDDGNKLDIKLAELLNKYQIRGTFYPSPGSKKFSLEEHELKQLAQFHEVGAHTISHPHLTRLPSEEIAKEIKSSKEYLENLLNKEIKMFCYPYGEFNETVKNTVKEAGFSGARTTKRFCIAKPDDFFEFGATYQVYPLSFWQTVKFFNWPRFSKSLFNQVLKNGGIYHLWGHSWEIEKYGMWQDLEKILRHIANRGNVAYLTNSQVLENL